MAHTFFVGEEQWLVHNDLNCKVFPNPNGLRIPSKQGILYAGRSDALYRSYVLDKDRKFTTIAVSEIDGRQVIGLNGSAPQICIYSNSGF
jgi:hypothetical protein